MIDAEVRVIIRRMVKENPTWGAPRIHGELLKLGFQISECAVSSKPDPSANLISFPRIGGLHHRYDWRQAA
jgi:hypothetical protein